MVVGRTHDGEKPLWRTAGRISGPGGPSCRLTRGARPQPAGRPPRPAGTDRPGERLRRAGKGAAEGQGNGRKQKISWGCRGQRKERPGPGSRGNVVCLEFLKNLCCLWGSSRSRHELPMGNHCAYFGGGGVKTGMKAEHFTQKQ